MVFTAIEIIAGLFAILCIIKILVILVKKKAWYNGVAKPIYGNPKASIFIFSIIAVVIFYFLIQSFSIVQIFALMAFASVLIAIGFLSYSKELMKIIDSVYNKKISGWLWLYMLVWLALSIWVLYEILIV